MNLHTKKRKPRQIAEFGDFQTPAPLAESAMRRFLQLGLVPRCIIEPTCGSGNFLAAAAAAFPNAERFVGRDINTQYLQAARAKLLELVEPARLDIQVGDFFTQDWTQALSECPEPWLIIGNPPWVTSSDLASMESTNVPQKSNFQQRSGIEAITGKGNFDISEWMLIEHMKWLDRRSGALAMLCKTSVARKILLHVWKHGTSLSAARIYKINATRSFGASVDACLFIAETSPAGNVLDCDVYDDIDAAEPSHSIGFHRGLLISDVDAFARYEVLFGPEDRYTWRSGIKHDCSKVMELVPEPRGGYRNGLGEQIDIEDTYLYPMLKSSQIANARIKPNGVMLVTQRTVGQDTHYIATRAPRTWKYLQDHSAMLSKRSSSIYRNKPPFSIFGVGHYTFAPWKVAISGFYKRLRFTPVGPFVDRPVVFDDTVYFLPCESEREALFISELLNSSPACGFYESMVHWSEKRPITVDLLKRLSLARVAEYVGRGQEYESVSSGAKAVSPRRFRLPADVAR